MKTKIFKNGLKLLLVCALMIGNLADKKLAPAHKGLLTQVKSLYKIMSHGQVWNDANAATVLSQADQVRFMYWLINGPPAEGYPAGRGGPDDGFLGMIRQINGPDALGGGLASCGYTTCDSIPSTPAAIAAAGPCAMTDAEGTFTMSFSTPSVAVPSGYSSTNNSGSYDKRISVNFSDGTNNVDFMIAEISCASSSGWMRFHQPSNEGTPPAAYTAGTRNTVHNLEVYYDTASASATKMELVMFKTPTSPSSQDEKERFAVKFATEADSKFQMWLTRYSYDGTDEHGFRIAVYGDYANDLANVFMEYDSTPDANTNSNVDTDSGNIATRDIDCIDFNDGGTALDGGGSCSALTLSTAGAPIKDGAGSFSMEWVRDSLAATLTTF